MYATASPAADETMLLLSAETSPPFLSTGEANSYARPSAVDVAAARAAPALTAMLLRAIANATTRSLAAPSPRKRKLVPRSS
jgi:hypothetical protein